MCDECDDWFPDEDSCDELDADSLGTFDDDEGNVRFSWETRRFIKALMDLDQEAIAHASAFYVPVEQPVVAKPTYVVHTLWTCQEVGGFFHYTVKHDLGSDWLDVLLDDPAKSFTWASVDQDTISIMATEKLFGVDVTVKRAGL